MYSFQHFYKYISESGTSNRIEIANVKVSTLLNLILTYFYDQIFNMSQYSHACIYYFAHMHVFTMSHTCIYSQYKK